MVLCTSRPAVPPGAAQHRVAADRLRRTRSPRFYGYPVRCAGRSAAERQSVGRLWRGNRFLCGCDSRFCALVRRVGPSFSGNRSVLDWQTDAQKSQSGLFVLFGAHSWQPILATQHRVATDAPVGAFKIRPILVKACAIYPVPRLQGRG